MMRIASVADVKAKLSGYIKESESGPIVVTKNGRPVAVLLGVHDEDEIERMVLAYSPKFRRIIHMAEKQIRESKGISHQEFWHGVEKKIG
jgi:prevent-host-death family protein